MQGKMEQFNLKTEVSDYIKSDSYSKQDKEWNLPLAEKLRPKSFDDYVGQEHILAKGQLLRRAIDADKFTSIILYGPPGTGKTTLAELIAKRTDAAFIRLSGVTSTIKDVRREISYALQRQNINKQKTILFIDEIHRFNKAQQDVLLPDVENGNIRLVGATTYNPHFYVIDALVSRSLVFQLEPLTEQNIITVLNRVTKNKNYYKTQIDIKDKASEFLAKISEGDARKALNALEIAILTTQTKNNKITITLKIAEASIQKKMITYGDDGHYDTASAFIKSMRGGDADAAIYWLAKMLHAGEDIRFIARRIAIFASEDIGNADPRAITLATSVMQSTEMIGMPEARIILSQAVTYCATAPKSNASLLAIDTALSDVKKNRTITVPKHLRDSHYKGAKDLNYGKDYIYPHNYKGIVNQDYLGVKKQYYNPVEAGYEIRIKERINYWNQFRENTN